MTALSDDRHHHTIPKESSTPALPLHMRGCTATAASGVLPDTPERACRVVTLPTEAAFDADAVQDLLRAGLNVAVIDTRFDSPTHWRAMAEQVRRASAALRQPVTVWLQLQGQSVHTVDLGQGPSGLKLKPTKDDFGRVYAPARLGLYALGGSGVMQRVDASVAVWSDWLQRLKKGDEIDFIDARGAKRHLMIEQIAPWGAVAQCPRTAYLNTQTVLRIGHSSKKKHSTLVCQLEHRSPGVRLHMGDLLRLTPHPTAASTDLDPPESLDVDWVRMGCSDAQLLAHLQPGQTLWLGGASLEATTQQVDATGTLLHITRAAHRGSQLDANTPIFWRHDHVAPSAPAAQELGWVRALRDQIDAVVSGPVHTADDLTTWSQALHTVNAPALVAQLASPQAAHALINGTLTSAAGVQAWWMKPDLLGLGLPWHTLAQAHAQWWRQLGELPVIESRQSVQSMVQSPIWGRLELAALRNTEAVRGWHVPRGAHQLDALSALSEALGGAV
ncbi:MAG: hypothetical protein Fur007_15780 [Rhodoferax sp.]